ncbi:hypothetical protein CDAR_441231 [Caerostris darwini]|uniref:Uncharacterized protein n=1 Tax=Caerostris darwini TaxID=1538125 RepID=A0AAV4PG23_9ARAC|nr:hypothetical protein CDAR_441231 [Caerostris darwini]
MTSSIDPVPQTTSSYSTKNGSYTIADIHKFQARLNSDDILDNYIAAIGDNPILQNCNAGSHVVLIVEECSQ